jgi:hypothetical protein
MRPNSVWLVFAIFTIAGIVELLRSQPLLPPFLVGLALLFLGLLAGLRWGTDAAARLIADMARRNTYLTEQNDQLSELNYELLSRLNETTAEEVNQE